MLHLADVLFDMKKENSVSETNKNGKIQQSMSVCRVIKANKRVKVAGQSEN